MVESFPESSEFGDELAEEFRHRIKAELEPGERLLWSSRGKPRRTGCGPIAWGLFIVGCLILSGVSFAAFFGKFGGPPVEGPTSLFFGLGAGAVGSIVLFAVLSEWLRGHYKRSPLDDGGLYALTDRRAIIWRRAPYQAGSIEVTTIARGQTKLIRRVEHPDGSGDVLFTLMDTWIMDGEWPIPGGFEGITDVRRVEDLARRVLFVDPGQNES